MQLCQIAISVIFLTIALLAILDFTLLLLINAHLAILALQIAAVHTYRIVQFAHLIPLAPLVRQQTLLLQILPVLHALFMILGVLFVQKPSASAA